MKSVPAPRNERARLDELREYDILDTLPEQAYDDIVNVAAELCGTPMAMISLVGDDRQWFKSKMGVEAAGKRNKRPFSKLTEYGRTFKEYRGMGSLGALKGGPRDRYFQDEYEDRCR